MDIVISSNMPFSACENATLRKYVRQSPICSKTLLAYMKRVTNIVEDRIRLELPEKFAIVVDGWTCAETHFLAIFATFSSSDPLGYSVILLAFTPLAEETSLNTSEHEYMIRWVLELFGKSFDNVVTIIGDNISTNHALADLAECHFIGCASHRLNLAVQDFLQPYQGVLSRVRDLTRKLRNLKSAAELRKHTNLKPKLDCPTRWSSSFEMVERYSKLRHIYGQLVQANVSNDLLSLREDQEIDTLHESLKYFNVFVKELQKDNMTLSKVHALFEEIVRTHPSLAVRLGKHSKKIKDPDFENGLVKLQLDQVSSLTSAEKEAVSALRSTSGSPDDTDDVHELQTDDSVIERAYKRQKRVCTVSAEYMKNLNFCLPTSNIVERFFSKVGYAYNKRRRGLTPVHLEEQLFLHVNRRFWSQADVQRATAENTAESSPASARTVVDHI